jgi:hypothetical protein
MNVIRSTPTPVHGGEQKRDCEPQQSEATRVRQAFEDWIEPTRAMVDDPTLDSGGLRRSGRNDLLRLLDQRPQVERLADEALRAPLGGFAPRRAGR